MFVFEPVIIAISFDVLQHDLISFSRLMQARAMWEEGNKARIEAEKQKQEVKDAKRVKEMNELRKLPTSEGGFMFKAREIERGVESSPNKTVPVHSTKPLTQPQTPKFATNTRSRCCRKY